MSADLSMWTRPRGAGPTRLALGAMNFGRRTPAAEAERIVARALERGITAFDTANAYQGGASEEILGRALRARREEVILATKVGFGRVGGASEGLSPARVAAAIDESLARLGTSYVDIYYLHVPDPKTPIEDTLGAIGDLILSGKIRAFGVSNYASWQILEMNAICDARGMPRPVIAQQIYNLLIRQLDVEYFKYATRHPLHTTVYNALAGGLLTGRHDFAAQIPAGSRFDANKLYQGRYWSRAFFDAVAAYREVASAEGLTPTQLAYAWLAGRPGVDSILVGPADVGQLDAALDGVSRPLSEAALRRIEEIHREATGTEMTYAR